MPGNASRGGAPVAVDIVFEAGRWRPRGALRGLAETAIAAAVARAGPRLAADCELAVIFTDDKHIHVLNQRHRKKDSATNVLSFPAAPAERGRFGPLLGDIILGENVIGTEAREQGLTLTDHVTHLIVHGFLHLVGYDHGNDREAVVMEGLETAILADLGIADPYAAG